MTRADHANAELDPTARRTRETWLEDAIAQMRPWFVEVGLPLPERIHISVGFGYGAKRESAKIQGQCWATWKSADKVNHVFLSPEIADPVQFLVVLLHELIHAGDDCASGHRGTYAEMATRLGLIAPLASAAASDELRDKLTFLAIELGDFPHAALDPRTVAAPSPVGPDGQLMPTPRGTSGPAPQTARLIKATCDQGCGYTIRITRKWLSVGLPTCPCGGTIAPEGI